MSLTYDSSNEYDSDNAYDIAGVAPVPITPVYDVPVAAIHDVSYVFCDIFTFDVLAILPISGTATFSYSLNGVGQLNGSFSMEDPAVINADWINATRANKAAVFVDIDGTYVWGGMVDTPQYTMSAQRQSFQASDFCGYINQRLQAKSYATNWSTTAKAAGAAQIAYQIISDALAVTGTIPLSVSTPAATPSEYAITFAAPISQAQTVGSILGQLQALGWRIGFDYACDVSQANDGTPIITITLSYPRRGRLAGESGLMFDVSQAEEFTWSEQGTLQASRFAEMGSAGGGSNVFVEWEQSLADGYPLTEGVSTQSSFSPTATPTSILNAWGKNDLALFAYPPVTATVTLPLFGTPTLGEWLVGDDVRLYIGADANGVSTVPRFPTGLDVYMRIVDATVTIEDQGKSTVDFTLNMPPTSVPQLPPQ